MKIIKFLDRYIEEYLLIFTTAVLVITLFIQVVTRNILGFTFPWTEELARYMFIWMLFIGVSYAVKKNKHLKIESLALLFKLNGRFFIRTVSNLAFLIFSVVVIYYGLNTAFGIQRTTPGLGISYGWVYASTLVGFSLAFIRLIQDQWKVTVRWRNKEGEEIL
ncbi:TRAP transporter small permease [Alteribacillus sp. YIM 98480]|uniref:TRAP transporter small permease n=1 Tax=Alteribacillus sp. YIM 98480 TaxID=2606599 RepID=UPI00131D76D6|nr:TRAP transporter small permease [Alteribacillus sp. YIM 98480]